MRTKESADYDVCIVGAGPAGLASLAAIRHPYSTDTLSDTEINRAVRSFNLHECLRVCVIDPDPWMEAWKRNFAALDITHLRSPALAHPDLFDRHALLAFACAHNREDELLESGCFEIKHLLSLGQSQVGLWKLPSANLFRDFCQDLASSLDHDYMRGSVVKIAQTNDASHSFHMTVMKSDNTTVSVVAKSVILATGASGRRVIPRGIRNAPRRNHWTELGSISTCIHEPKENVLVVGGGLTAVQVALKFVKQGHSCVLCSRRPLAEQHFDISLEWFDHRTMNQRLSSFYHQSIQERLALLKEARNGGGSIPPIYMRQVEQANQKGKLKCLVGDPWYMGETKQGKSAILINDGKAHMFDKVVCACGIQPDCRACSLVDNVLKKWPIPVRGGFPSITQDLRWKDGMDLFVVGSLGSLNIGPDAGNLMGIRRAAQIVANSLGCRCWLREKVWVNPFDALLETSDDSSVETDDESEESLPLIEEEHLLCCKKAANKGVGARAA